MAEEFKGTTPWERAGENWKESYYNRSIIISKNFDKFWPESTVDMKSANTHPNSDTKAESALLDTWRGTG